LLSISIQKRLGL